METSHSVFQVQTGDIWKVLTVPHQWTLVSLCVFWFCAWLLFSVLKGQMGMHYVLKTMFKPLCVLIKLQWRWYCDNI